MKKYELLQDQTIQLRDNTLYRIKRLSDGYLGGYIESEDNLSHEGPCFVHENARVYNGSVIIGSAQVYGNAEITEDSIISGNSRVGGDSRITGGSLVSKDALAVGFTNLFGCELTMSAINFQVKDHLCTIADNTITTNNKSYNLYSLTNSINKLGHDLELFEHEKKALHDVINGFVLLRGLK